MMFMSSGARASIRSFSVCCSPSCQQMETSGATLRVCLLKPHPSGINRPHHHHHLSPRALTKQKETLQSQPASQPGAPPTTWLQAVEAPHPPSSPAPEPPPQCRDKSRPASDTSALRPGREEKGGRHEMQYSYENYKAGSDVTWHRGT